jgi:hypothetical protein
MFFDQAAPDTSTYMVAGYVIFFIITVIYVVSLFIRERNLHRDLLTLETLRDERKATLAPPTPRSRAPKPARAASGSAKKSSKRSRRKQ